MNFKEASSIPKEIAVCPYCQSELYIQDIGEWQQNDDGEWMPIQIDIECTTEPDLVVIDEGDEGWDDWKDWSSQHSYMPYVYWLPVQDTIEKWLRKPEQCDRRQYFWAE